MIIIILLFYVCAAVSRDERKIVLLSNTDSLKSQTHIYTSSGVLIKSFAVPPRPSSPPYCFAAAQRPRSLTRGLTCVRPVGQPEGSRGAFGLDCR
jgi:hypothetical protein